MKHSSKNSGDVQVGRKGVIGHQRGGSVRETPRTSLSRRQRVAGTSSPEPATLHRASRVAPPAAQRSRPCVAVRPLSHDAMPHARPLSRAPSTLPDKEQASTGDS